MCVCVCFVRLFASRAGIVASREIDCLRRIDLIARDPRPLHMSALGAFKMEIGDDEKSRSSGAFSTYNT